MVQGLKKTEAVDHWMSEINKGLEFRKRYSYFPSWKDYREAYRGKWDKNITPVNRTFSYGRSLIPRVYFRNPRVTITAARPDLVWHAKVLEAVDNWLIKELMLKAQLKRGVLDAYPAGIGIFKLGYDSEYGYLPQQAVAGSSSTATMYGRKTGTDIEYTSFIKPGMPWALSVTPDEIVVPWGSKNTYERIPWICHMIVRPLEDVKEDQKYNKHRLKLKGTLACPTEGKDLFKYFDAKNHRQADKNLCLLFEIRDKKEKRIITLCENAEIMNETDELQIEGGLPYEFLIFNEDPEYFWPIPDTAILEPQQRELNETRTQASMHRKIAVLKILAKAGVLTKKAKDQLLSGDVGALAEIETDESIAAVLQVLEPHILPDFERHIQAILQDMREGLGFSSNELGEFYPKTGKTATEANIVRQAFEVRLDERRDAMADVLENIIRKWNQMIFRFWDDEKVIQVAGAEGGKYWIRYTGQQLEGEYLYNIDPESGIPITRRLKDMYAMELFKIFNGDPYVDQIMLRKLILNRAEEILPSARFLLSEQPDVGRAAIQEIFNRKLGGRGRSPERPMAFEEGRRELTQGLA